MLRNCVACDTFLYYLLKNINECDLNCLLLLLLIDYTIMYNFKLEVSSVLSELNSKIYVLP